MSNWINKVKDKYELLKKQEERKIFLKKLKEIITINVLASLGMFIVCGLCLIFSFQTSTPESIADMGLLLAIVSLSVTSAFEGYEWFRMFKKNNTNVSTIPFAIADIFVILFTYLKSLESIWNAIIGFTNFICAITLFFYVVVVTVRIIITNARDIKN